MDLKKKILENTVTIRNLLRSFEYDKYHVFPSGLVAHGNDKVLLLDDVLDLLNEILQENSKLKQKLGITIEDDKTCV